MILLVCLAYFEHLIHVHKNRVRITPETFRIPIDNLLETGDFVLNLENFIDLFLVLTDHEPGF